MKKLSLNIISLLIAFPLVLTIEAQSVNEDFLNGIPDDVMQDIIGNQEEGTYDEDIYISDESKIKKTSSELKKLVRDAKRLEQKFNNGVEQSSILSRYGSDIFNTFQTTFMPINEPNLDQSYIVDVGDGLRIQILGSINIDKKLKVMRDGSINLPEVGKLTVAGLELSEVNSMIKKIIEDSFLGNTAFVTLTDIRNIKVYILGNVPNPGMYTLNGNSNLIHAISVAGGINDNGSYRDIELKRSGKLIGSSDLYSTLIFGDTSSNYPLRSGDVVLVKSSKRLVSISGAVSRPAIYELKGDEKLENLIDMAGGLTGDFLDDHVNISTAQSKKISKVTSGSFKSYKLLHNDSISVPFFKPEVIKTKTATVSGSVNFPGEYNISENETLVSLISKAGGYKKNAYPYAGILTRKNAFKTMENFRKKELGSLIKYLISGSNGAQSKAGMMTADSTSELLEEIRNHIAWDAGRFSIEFDLDKITRDPSKDTGIIDGDTVHIPEFSNEVYIFGELNGPGVRSYTPGASVHEYIDIAGGISQNAFESGIILINPDGQTKLVSKSTLLNFLSTDEGLDVYPHSIIFVPRDIARLDSLTKGTYIAQIVSSSIFPLLTLMSINKKNND